MHDLFNDHVSFASKSLVSKGLHTQISVAEIEIVQPREPFGMAKLEQMQAVQVANVNEFKIKPSIKSSRNNQNLFYLNLLNRKTSKTPINMHKRNQS